ncbi:universal stress protein [Glycomyces sp. NPDC021274]|uniref:universal stress protein n=1 Tax=Glycomyces sp. NPDC021274 TaxID=3155120 RepID=UPI0033E43B50
MPSPRASAERRGSAADEPRHLLVATDFSASAKAALERALQLTQWHEASLTLLHVAPNVLEPATRHIAERHLQELAAWCGTVPVQTLIATGSASAEIVAAAKRLHADLIVLGGHGEHGSDRQEAAYVGACAETVADTSEVPVLVVKSEDQPRYRTVVIAIEETDRALSTAATGVAFTPGARHVAAHAAAVPGEDLLRLAGVDRLEIDRLRRARLREVRPRLESLVRAVEDVRPVRLVVGSGRAEDLIADLTARIGADLVITGTRQSIGRRQALLGSIGRHTIRKAPCDVLIAHSP